MKGIKSLEEMKRELQKISSGVASDTIFTAKAMFFIAKKLDELVKLQRGRELSDYHRFMSYKLHVENLPFKEALEQWKELPREG